MARLVGIMTNRRDRMSAIAHQERGALLLPGGPNAPSGWGVGFYDGPEILHRKHPHHDGAFCWENVLGQMHAKTAVLHAAMPQKADLRVENLHPFRLKNWLFAQVGTFEQFGQVAEKLRASIHPSLVRNIRGQTDSETFFHVVLSRLFAAGVLDRKDGFGPEIASALRSVTAEVDHCSEKLGGNRPNLASILTNGHIMAVMPRGVPMSYIVRRGFHDAPEGLAQATGPRTIRYALFASGEVPQDYEPIKTGAVVVVERDISISIL